jgi:hypothetical protein
MFGSCFGRAACIINCKILTRMGNTEGLPSVGLLCARMLEITGDGSWMGRWIREKGILDDWERRVGSAYKNGFPNTGSE